MTAREVSKLFQVSERTVWRLCETGQIPPPIRFGRVIRWNHEGLKKWIDAGSPIDPEWKKQAEKVGKLEEEDEADEG